MMNAFSGCVQNNLDQGLLDILFIDGGHDYQTVSGDLSRFAPLVRHGGLIAFHDILPGAGAGDVPRFWSEIRDSYDTEEIVGEGPDEEPLGIGVLHVDTSGT